MADTDELGATADQLEAILFPGRRTMTYAHDSLTRARKVIRELSIDDFHALCDLVDARSYVALQQANRWKAISDHAAKEAALPTSPGASKGDKS